MPKFSKGPPSYGEMFGKYSVQPPIGSASPNRGCEDSPGGCYNNSSGNFVSVDDALISPGTPQSMTGGGGTAGKSTTTPRPQPARSPYEWMKKPAFQSNAEKNGELRTYRPIILVSIKCKF